MKYIIKHGSIAALQYVKTPEGEEISVTYTKEHQPKFEAFPLSVKAAVNRQFGLIFSLPYRARQEFIDNSIPFEVVCDPVASSCSCGCVTPYSQWLENESGYRECPECRGV